MPFRLQQTHLKTQDLELFNFNRWTVDEKKDLFTIVEMKNLPYEHDDNTWLSVTLEMDLDLLEYTRARYTVLDLLASFGGFIGIWGKLFAFFMGAWNYNALDNYMVSRLYRMRTKEESERIIAKKHKND